MSFPAPDHEPSKGISFPDLSAFTFPAFSREVVHNVPFSEKEQAERLLAQEPALLREAQRITAAVGLLPIVYPDTPPAAHAVGGFVRDALIGLKPKDLDLEVRGVNPEVLEVLLNKLYPGRVNTTGRSFCVFKVALDGGFDIDVSITRTESSTGPGTKDFKVTGNPDISLREAARRRDFTMNTLAADVITGKVYDEFNGLNDLRYGILAVTDIEKFQEDPLRVYRAVQFSARLNLTAEPGSLSLMRKMVADGALEHLAKERITEEFTKLLLKSEKPSIGFELMHKLGITGKYFPELEALRTTEQDALWHPEGNVWIHTMKAVDHVAGLLKGALKDAGKNYQLAAIYGALCHDIGKPETTVFKDGHIRSPGHDVIGEEISESFLKRLKLSEDVVKLVTRTTRLHMKPGALVRDLERGTITEKEYANRVRMLLKELSPAKEVKDYSDYLKRMDVFLSACAGDFYGRALPDLEKSTHTSGAKLREAVNNFQLDNAALISGKALNELGLSPGKLYSHIIREIESYRDKGKLETKAEALNHIKRNYLIKGSDLTVRGIPAGPETGKLVMEVRSLIMEGKLSGRSDAMSYLNQRFGLPESDRAAF